MQKIDRLKQQVSIQSDIRLWAGNPAEAAGRVVLDRLGAGDLLRDFGRTRAAILATAESLASLGHTASGTYRAIDDADLEGGALTRDALAHRRYAVLAAQQQNYDQVLIETKARERELREDLAETLAALKDADTDAEVRKQTAKVEALNGQLATLGAKRREQADQITTQKIANDARLEQERLAAAELEAKDNFLANQRVTAFMRTISVRKNTP